MSSPPHFCPLFERSEALDKAHLEPGADSTTPAAQNSQADSHTITHVPDQPTIDLLASEVYDFLSEELNTRVLDELYSQLWLVGTKSGWNIDALHVQRLKGRSICPTEDPHLHLIWTRNRIHLKPIPPCLFNYDFWTLFLRPQEDEKTGSIFDSSVAVGFLRSYAHLVPRRLDFILAKESHLIPEEVDWAQWSRFIGRFRRVGDEKVGRRYHYGQLRLSRLNWAVRIFRPQHARTWCFYHIPHWSIWSYLSEATVPLLFAFASVSVVLSAMQVILSVSSDAGFLGRLEALPQMELVFWVFSISMVFLSGLIWLLLLVIPMSALLWQLAWGFRRRGSTRASSA